MRIASRAALTRPMAQIFPEACNAIARWSVPALASAVALALLGLIFADRVDYRTFAHIAPPQPVPFSHRHHAGELGIGCRFCHANVERGAAAGVPAATVCMKCHAEVWRDAAVLAPVRDAFRTGDQVVWARVHDLPDFVAFDHSIHVNAGVACSACHGRVEGMVAMHETTAMAMGWCLDCHSHAGVGDASDRLVDCTTCHR